MSGESTKKKTDKRKELSVKWRVISEMIWLSKSNIDTNIGLSTQYQFRSIYYASDKNAPYFIS